MKQTVEGAGESRDDLSYRNNREMFYGFKDGSYVHNPDYQSEHVEVLIQQSWDAAAERLDKVRRKVAEEKRSPIAYFMEKNLMDIPMLAAYTGFYRLAVRMHLIPRIFRELSDDKLDRYASVFGITREELKNRKF